MRIHPEILKALKLQFAPGTCVELIRMNDPYTNLKPGDKGTVKFVDDIGTIHISWDRGSSLGVVYGEDECRRID